MSRTVRADRRFAAVAATGTLLVSVLAGFLNATARVSSPFTFQIYARYHLRVADAGTGAVVAWWLLPVCVAGLVAAVVTVAAYSATWGVRTGDRSRLRATASFLVVAVPVFLFGLLAEVMRPLTLVFGLEPTMVPIPGGRLALWGLVVPFGLFVLLPVAGVRWHAARATEQPTPWAGRHVIPLAASLLVGFALGDWLGVTVGDALVVVGEAGW